MACGAVQVHGGESTASGEEYEKMFCPDMDRHISLKKDSGVFADMSQAAARYSHTAWPTHLTQSSSDSLSAVNLLSLLPLFDWPAPLSDRVPCLCWQS